MSDLDSFDLDAAFRGLEQDIAGISAPRGAGQAVAAARRRRRTTIGAIAAVAVLIVGGAAIGQGLHGRDQSVGPAGSLPDPAPLTAQALSAATNGWVSGWSSRTPEEAHFKAGPLEHCLARTTGTSDKSTATRGSGNLFFDAGHAGALATLSGFDTTSDADAAWSGISKVVATCSSATPARQLSWDGASSQSYATLPGVSPKGHFWVARVGSTFGFVWISGASTDITSAVDDNVAQALVAALEYPGSMRAVPSSSSHSASSEAFVSAEAFAAALGSWSSGWSATHGDAPDSLPCEIDLSSGQKFGSSTFLGANGGQTTYGYASAAAASAKLGSLASQLRGCPPNVVQEVPLGGGGSVLVGSATGSGQQDVWVVRHGRTLAVIQTPAGDSAPPQDVDASVGKLLTAWLDAQ